MKRKHKNYSRPKRPFDKARIEEEKKIVKEFGLKNKKEIWKAEAKINSFRERAKKLVSKSDEDKKIFFSKLNKIGLNVNSIAEVLSLTKENLLNRRLQTIDFKKEIAKTPKEARQMITHKKILVDGEAINIPSYIVPVELENKITAKSKKEKKKEVVKSEVEENSEESEEDKE
jgi:small subunit ribosomal protein S4